MIADRFKWSHETIGDLATDKAFAYCLWIRERDKSDAVWQMNVADYPHNMDKKSREQMRAKILGMSGGRTRKSSFDYASTHGEMLRMIGDALLVGGEQWVRDHPKRMAWLSKNGYSRQDAIDAVKTFTEERHAIANKPRLYKVVGVGSNPGSARRK